MEDTNVVKGYWINEDYIMKVDEIAIAGVQHFAGYMQRRFEIIACDFPLKYYYTPQDAIEAALREEADVYEKCKDGVGDSFARIEKLKGIQKEYESPWVEIKCGERDVPKHKEGMMYKITDSNKLFTRDMWYYWGQDSTLGPVHLCDGVYYHTPLEAIEAALTQKQQRYIEIVEGPVASAIWYPADKIVSDIRALERLQKKYIKKDEPDAPHSLDFEMCFLSSDLPWSERPKTPIYRVCNDELESFEVSNWKLKEAHSRGWSLDPAHAIRQAICDIPRDDKDKYSRQRKLAALLMKDTEAMGFGALGNCLQNGIMNTRSLARLIDVDMFDEEDLIIEQTNDYTIQFTLRSDKYNYNTSQVAGTFAITTYEEGVLDYTMEYYSMLFPKATIKRRED